MAIDERNELSVRVSGLAASGALGEVKLEVRGEGLDELPTDRRNVAVGAVVRGLAAAGVQALDTVFTDVTDPDGLRRDCRESAAIGYTGKISIHPSQIDVINEEFTPSACSSNSARPVRRETASTSGTSNSNVSTCRATRVLSVRLVPGSAWTLIVSVPSLNGGRNSPPIHAIDVTDNPTKTLTNARIA